MIQIGVAAPVSTDGDHDRVRDTPLVVDGAEVHPGHELVRRLGLTGRDLHRQAGLAATS